MTTSPKVVAVIPAFNEAKTIGAVVADLAPHVSEIIVVDDHSSDGTGVVARNAGAFILRRDRNAGYDTSLNDGFKAAVEHGADIIFTFDADGEHSATDVPRVVGPILAGEADIVAGQRLRTIHWSEKLFALYTRLRYGIIDPLCGFKAYRRNVYEAVGHFDSVQSIGTELMLRGLSKGFRLALVPIELRTRQEDSSRFYRRNFRANLKIIRAMWRVLAV